MVDRPALPWVGGGPGGHLSDAELRGPRVRRVAYDTYVFAAVPDSPRLAIRSRRPGRERTPS